MLYKVMNSDQECLFKGNYYVCLEFILNNGLDGAIVTGMY